VSFSPVLGRVHRRDAEDAEKEGIKRRAGLGPVRKIAASLIHIHFSVLRVLCVSAVKVSCS